MIRQTLSLSKHMRLSVTKHTLVRQIAFQRMYSVYLKGI